ncbi:Uncharacterized protein SAPIO_CDS3567 [Scedosporium apiospermum]|uniref:J domain-containing protein n=1 Tax=Pseudallescheria apiosperma TaxID=563466 RepID=A0A084GB31_PSEDA|nr:Uncharacterized protein SAPIO_CDS3567 [Scedosporium apiospermum]KEZ44543.1 Uncharacterized protein SAPIO_CDS3567 [Scedosporium apiospermum]
MRFSLLSIGLLALLTPLTAAWSKEDREIFRVRDEIRAQEGGDLTFYDILEIPPNASQDEITKAYRKKTRSLHPDKVRQNLISESKKRKKKDGKPGVKATKPPSESEIRSAQRQASERQTRLSLIANILRGPERARYDHFLSNGFPTWKGTNYYYSRYRPGLGTVLVGLFIVGGGGFHYLALYMSWKRRREFLERYIKFARQTAWGENLGIPTGGAAAAAARQSYTADSDADADEESYQPRNRRERRLQERESRREQGKKAPKKKSPAANQEEQSQGGPTGTRKRVVAENGKILVVDSLGDVYLEEEDADGNVELFLLDPNELRKPDFTDTAVVRVPLWALRMAMLRVAPRPQPVAIEDDEEEAEKENEVEDDDSEPAQPTPSTGSDVGDFEVLEKSTDSLEKAKTTGAQAQTGGKKRRNKKR